MPEAVDSINGHIIAYFKFLGCDTGSQELNRDADFLFGCLVSESREFLKIINSLGEINATLVCELHRPRIDNHFYTQPRLLCTIEDSEE